jgi:hypothetical protein
VVEPPAPATLIGRIFAHRRRSATVVRATLVETEAFEPVGPADSPGVADVVGPADAPAAPPGGAARAATLVATRYCRVCAERVAVAPDGLHCRRGHRLSPAHAARRRGRFGRH